MDAKNTNRKNAQEDVRTLHTTGGLNAALNQKVVVRDVGAFAAGWVEVCINCST